MQVLVYEAELAAHVTELGDVEAIRIVAPPGALPVLAFS